MNHSEDDDPSAGAQLIEISHEALSEEALRGVIENFVLREGTEYGEQEIDLEAKVRAVQQQLRAGEAIIVFEPSEQTVDIRLRDA